MIHLGLAEERHYYSLETQAHRGLYIQHDVWDENLENDHHWQETDVPAVLEPSFDVVKLCNELREATTYDIRPSSEAGLFLCEFIHFTSLSEFWQRGMALPIIFCHVPLGSQNEDVARGADVVLAIISNLVSPAAEL